MTVDHLPQLAPPAFGDVCDPARPILSYYWRSQGPHRVPAHHHCRGHILRLEQGAYWVITADARWLAASGQAIWIPPETSHEVLSQGPVVAHVLFVDGAHSSVLPGRCGTMRVTALLAELCSRVAEYGNDYDEDGPEARMARVLLDELARVELAPFMLPISREPRLALAMQRIIEAPGTRGHIDQVARHSGASPRTLARLFVQETGLTFTQWRIRFVLVAAINRLAQGTSVTEVATELGYSPSSFTYMFRTHLGVPPGFYFSSWLNERKTSPTRRGAHPPSARSSGHLNRRGRDGHA